MLVHGELIVDATFHSAGPDVAGAGRIDDVERVQVGPIALAGHRPPPPVPAGEVQALRRRVEHSRLADDAGTDPDRTAATTASPRASGRCPRAPGAPSCPRGALPRNTPAGTAGR